MKEKKSKFPAIKSPQSIGDPPKQYGGIGGSANNFRGTTGSFLIELMIATAILVTVLVGYLQLSIVCFGLTETTRYSTLAFSEALGKLEEIRNHDFSTIITDYGPGGTPGNIFGLSQLTGTGVIFITSINSDLLQVEILASWREKGGRVIGEDKNLNGALNGGEDANANTRLDSPVSIITLIARK